MEGTNSQKDFKLPFLNRVIDFFSCGDDGMIDTDDIEPRNDSDTHFDIKKPSNCDEVDDHLLSQSLVSPALPLPIARRPSRRNFQTLSKEEQNLLCSLKKKLNNGLEAKIHKLYSEPKKIILGCNPDFFTLCWWEVVAPWHSFQDKIVYTAPHLGTSSEVRSGTAPDPNFPGFCGTLILRNSHVSAAQTLAIIWPRYELNLELKTAEECEELVSCLKLWRSVLV